MKRFIEGENRSQSTLLPEYLDDYIAEDNPVRVIEMFVDELDHAKLGFHGIEPEATGRPVTTLRQCSRSTFTATSTASSRADA